MSMVYSKLKGRKLVKYVANATGLEQKECEEILETFVQDIETIDAKTLEQLSEKTFLKKRLEKAFHEKQDEVAQEEEEEEEEEEEKEEKKEEKKVEKFMKEVENCSKILGFARSLTYQNYLVINDPIHGTIELHPLLVKIIDCPLFQRLRHIKQLGGVSYVYPGATHTRFEHSIGVCHLAGEVMKNLMTKQPELGLTDKDLLCVQIAGLCHDLGHGPFSHMFEWVAKEIREKKGAKWEHEEISCKALATLMKEESAKQAFKRFGLNDEDIQFVKNVIRGEHRENENEKKGYLLKVVANKKSGCDVDKWDYFARDCYYLGIPCDFDFSRFVKGIRVARDRDEEIEQLCFRDKEVNNVYGMFRTRGNLHQKALQHKTSQVIQHMMSEALISAAGVKIFVQWVTRLSLADVVNKAAEEDDLSDSGWKDFDDRFLLLIMNSKDVQLKQAQSILRRIENREIYKYLGCAYVKKKKCEYFHEHYKKENLRELVEKHHGGHLNNLRVLTAVISQPSESKETPGLNPVDLVKFYKKEDPTTIVKITSEKVSGLVKPTAFSETCLQVYNAGEGDGKDCWSAFKKWADSVEKKPGKPVFEPIKDDPERYQTTSPRKHGRGHDDNNDQEGTKHLRVSK